MESQRGKLFVSDPHWIQYLTAARPTATVATWKRYRVMTQHMNMNEVESSSHRFNPECGREWAIVTSSDAPKVHRLFDSRDHLADAQKLGLDAQLYNYFPTDYDSDSDPPRRKRRRHDARVKFHPVVYIRTEADIDSICEPNKPWKYVVRETVPAKLPRNILRTVSEPTDLTPRRSHEVWLLNWKDKQIDRKKLQGRRGMWKSPTPETSIVNTSGCRADWNDAKSMAERWKYVDSFDQDLSDEVRQSEASNEQKVRGGVI